MSANTALPPIKMSLAEETAHLAAALSKNEVLKWVALALVGAIAVLSLAVFKVSKAVINQKPLIVRVTEVGRAEAIDYKWGASKPTEREMQYFLTQFVTGFFERNHTMTPRDYHASLYFLKESKLRQVQEEDRKSNWYAKFMTSSDEDIDINVKKIGLDLSSDKPYRAKVDFDKIFTAAGGGESKREEWTCTIAFGVGDVTNEYAKHNPLGFQIVYIQPEQAFTN